MEEASRCINCKNAKCIQGCPVGINIPAFVHEVKEGNIEEAYKIIGQSSALPAVCGRVCPQESQCEGKCIRGIKGESISIGKLERFVADYALEHDIKPAGAEVKNGHKVAVIGSGPSGLTCAGDLAKLGYDVTVFEALHELGGVLVYGIPEFRLPKQKIVAKEIEKVKELGVKFETNVVIGKSTTIDQLMEEEGFEAVFIGSGAGLPMFMGIPGENANEVFSANEYLTRSNLMKAFDDSYDTPIAAGKKVAVVGGGNVAMDVCRTAIRLGAQDTYVIYRRSQAEMPADAEEVAEAMEEGVQFRFLSAPAEILGENGKVKAIKVEIMELGEPDEKGRRKPVGTGEFETLAVSAVISAIGQQIDLCGIDAGSKLRLGKRGTVLVDPATYQTDEPDVFAGGDLVTGPKFAIDAIAAGKEAAISLHRFVHPGQTLTAGRDRRVYRSLAKEHVLLATAGFDKDHRQMPGYNAAKAKTFSDARVTFTEEQVKKECARCLGCGATKVDSYLCIGCGLCTTKCKFDAIHLKKVRDWHAGSYETMPIKVAEGVVKRAGSIVKKAVLK